MNSAVYDSVKALCNSTDGKLWFAYRKAIGVSGQEELDSRLIFPEYTGKHKGKIRVSEQEARFAFSESLAGTKYYYSVETPTEADYQLTGSKPMSAQTDLTLYDRNIIPILNVEFKSKGFSTSAQNLFVIEKDVQKLLREAVPGMWFHILESVDNSTLGKTLGTLAASLHKTVDEYGNTLRDTELIFHFCVLRHGFSIHKSVIIHVENQTMEDIKQQFHFSYDATQSELLAVNDPNGWEVNRSASVMND